jgi:hypothetical protein
LAHKVGLRPCRTSVRLEEETVVHGGRNIRVREERERGMGRERVR